MDRAAAEAARERAEDARRSIQRAEADAAQQRAAAERAARERSTPVAGQTGGASSAGQAEAGPRQVGASSQRTPAPTAGSASSPAAPVPPAPTVARSTRPAAPKATAVAAAQTRVVQARAAVAAAATPTERSQAARELEVAERRLAVTSEKVPSRPERRSSAAPSPSSSPEVARTTRGEEQQVTLAQAYSYFEDVVPGRNTGLVIALVGGIVALLVLLAREWSR